MYEVKLTDASRPRTRNKERTISVKGHALWLSNSSCHLFKVNAQSLTWYAKCRYFHR